MNIIKFYELLNRALDSTGHWHDVLVAICELTGAKKAIIALRDNKTAELVVPETVSDTNISPVVFGFSEIDVENYLTKYYALDPWTDIERRKRPVVSYHLSTYLPTAQLRASPFWPWLDGQGISDTHVAELDSGARGWVALNIYFDGANRKTGERVQAFMHENLAAISRSWKLFQQIQKYRCGETISPRLMATFENPALFFNSGMEIVAINRDGAKSFAEYFDCDRNFALGPMPFVCRKAIENVFATRRDAISPHNFPPNENDDVLIVRAIHHGEDVVGRETNIWLATIESRENKRDVGARIWENASLTAREREVVQAIAEGLSLSEFARKTGLSANTCKSYLRDARRKMGGIRAKDIYARGRRD